MSEAPVHVRIQLWINEHALDADEFALPPDEQLRPALAMYLETLAKRIESGERSDEHDL